MVLPPFQVCIGFEWQGVGSGGLLEASTMSSGATPASLKMDLLMAKVEPIGNAGSTSGIMYLRTEKNWARATAAAERSESM